MSAILKKYFEIILLYMILFENQALSPDKFLSCEPHLVQSVPPGPGQDAEVVKRPGHVSVSSAIAEECLVVIVNGETPPSGDKSGEQWQQDEDESLKDSHFPRGPPLLLLLFLGPIGPLELGLSVGWLVGCLSGKLSLGTSG